MRIARGWVVAGLLLAPAALAAQGIDDERLRAAAAYSAAHKGISLLVMVDGRVVFEDYPNSGSPRRAHELASGTKSFSGVMAVAAAQDGLLRLDEKVSQTITEWRGDPRKSKITIRQLLSLTSGVETSVEAGNVPTYAEAIRVRAVRAPGQTFVYGTQPFQIFGEIMLRKLALRGGEDPLDYLKRRIFDPIGLEIERWRRGRTATRICRRARRSRRGSGRNSASWSARAASGKGRGSWAGSSWTSASRGPPPTRPMA